MPFAELINKSIFGVYTTLSNVANETVEKQNDSKNNNNIMILSEISCGLDFGTSNSVITLTDKKTKEKLFTYSDSSILYFPKTNDMVYYVGEEARKQYFKEEMEGRLLKSVKTLLRQDKFLFAWIFGKKITPEQLVTCIISHLKKKGEEYIGAEIKNVTLGRPAIFSEDSIKEDIAVKRLITAAKNAGFENIKLQLEPIAAAFTYEKSIKKPETVLVADFGAGTSDFTIMRLSPEKSNDADRRQDIIAHGGVYIGGDLFDSEIMWYKVTPDLGRGVKYKSFDKELEIPTSIFWELRNWERSFLLKESKLRRSMNSYYVFSGKNPKIRNYMTLIDNNYVFSLFKSIEKSKISLSSNKETEIVFNKDVIDIYQPFKLNEFETIIMKHTTEIKQKIFNILDSVNFKPNDIDSVFITGGSSLVVPVRQVLANIFGDDKINSQDTFNSVSYGLSLY